MTKNMQVAASDRKELQEGDGKNTCVWQGVKNSWKAYTGELLKKKQVPVWLTKFPFHPPSEAQMEEAQ